MSELQVTDVILWNRVCSKFMEITSSLPAFEVDLSFEVHEPPLTDTYASGKKIIISDLRFDSKMVLNVATPKGMVDKLIPFDNFDIISTRVKGGNVYELTEVVRTSYASALSTFEYEERMDLPLTIEDFVKKVREIKPKRETAKTLNNSDEFLKREINSVIDAEAFGDMDDYGMF